MKPAGPVQAVTKASGDDQDTGGGGATTTATDKTTAHTTADRPCPEPTTLAHRPPETEEAVATSLTAMGRNGQRRIYNRPQ